MLIDNLLFTIGCVLCCQFANMILNMRAQNVASINFKKYKIGCAMLLGVFSCELLCDGNIDIFLLRRVGRLKAHRPYCCRDHYFLNFLLEFRSMNSGRYLHQLQTKQRFRSLAAANKIQPPKPQQRRDQQQ